MDKNKPNKKTPEKMKLNPESHKTQELMHNLHVHHIELEAQNEELREMQHKLEEVRDRYTDLFDFAPVGYFILDKNGIITNVNLTGSGMLNMERSRVKGKPFTAFISNGDGSQVFFKHLRDVYKTELLHSCELILKRKGDKPFYAHLDTIAEVIETTGETSFRTTLRDLTDERKTEELQQLNEELRIAREKTQQYLHYSGVFFVTLDTSGTITMINQVGCKTLGHECMVQNSKCKIDTNGFCHLEGLNWFDNFIPKRERAAARLEFNNLIKSEKRKNIHSQNFVVTKNGDERIIAFNSVVIKDKHGNITGILKSGEDVTEKIHAEKALKESEKMFRTLFENSTESIIISNRNGIILNTNPITTKLFGYKQNDLMGQHIDFLIPDDLKTTYHKLYKNFNNSKTPISLGEEMNLYAQHKNGSKFNISISLSSIVVDDQPLVMALISDITDRVKAKQKLENLNVELEQKVIERTHELRESQQLYKLIARNFPNGVINVFDKNLNYVFVEGMEMFNKGVSGEMLIGTSFLKRINPLIRTELKENLMNVFKGHNISFESKIENKIYMINAVGLQDANNNVSQILMVTQNITNLKKAENQTKQALEKERELNDLKTRFVSIASHEFRTPLTTIMNSVSLLSKHIGKEDTTEKQHDHINRVKKSVHNLTNILNDFLSLDKLDGGNVESHPTELNLTQFFKEIIDSLEVITKTGQQIIDVYHGPENIIVDKQALTNIFNNLLCNAIKYSGENTTIDVKINVEDEVLSVIIKDEGIGILKNDQDKIFERFFRTKEAFETQGTGLGLNIVKKYVEIANGVIDFESRYRRGTTFKVKIPVKIDSKIAINNSVNYQTNNQIS